MATGVLGPHSELAAKPVAPGLKRTVVYVIAPDLYMEDCIVKALLLNPNRVKYKIARFFWTLQLNHLELRPYLCLVTLGIIYSHVDLKIHKVSKNLILIISFYSH